MITAVFHYHLNRGGVTRVIESHLRALASVDVSSQPDRVVVFYGGRAADWKAAIAKTLPFPVELRVIPELDYDDICPVQATELAGTMVAELQAIGCSSKNTVLHVHNHSLGKKAAFPEALSLVAKQGWRLLLQIHDFAEDLRPQNYTHMLQHAGGQSQLHNILYPQATQIHYAALNARDYHLLRQAGVPDSRLHRLPNPVSTQEASRADNATQGRNRMLAREKLQACLAVAPDQTYILYPVRGIRRKNLGELLLWAKVCEGVGKAVFATTLAPMNPTEQTSYQRWKELAERMSLPVVFEAGEHLSLEENYAAADGVLTTSVAEGFGLVFLEATQQNRPLLGRDLPEITADFVDAGMKFPGLATSIQIPCEWVDVQAAQQTLREHAISLREAIGWEISDRGKLELEQEIEACYGGDTIDFAKLSTEQQTELLLTLDRADRCTHLIATNPVFQKVATLPHDARSESWQSLQRQNQRVIATRFSEPTIGKSLADIYDRLLATTADTDVTQDATIAAHLQAAFLSPRQIVPLRLEA